MELIGLTMLKEQSQKIQINLFWPLPLLSMWGVIFLTRVPMSYIKWATWTIPLSLLTVVDICPGVVRPDGEGAGVQHSKPVHNVGAQRTVCSARRLQSL